jgi:PAS domain S-box-containing protein
MINRFYISWKSFNYFMVIAISFCLIATGIYWNLKNKVNQNEPVSGILFSIELLLLAIFVLTLFLVLSYVWFYRSKNKAVEAYKIKSDEFENFFDSSMDMLCISDKNGFFQHLNPEWERTLGYSLSDLKGKKFLDFVHPGDIEETINATQLAGSGKISNFTNRYKHKDGSFRWIEWRSYPIGESIYASARDITERKKTEKTLLENEEKFRIAFENAPFGMSIINAEGKYIAVNPKLCEMFGYSEEELLSGTIYNITHPDDIEPSNRWVKKILSGDMSEPEFIKRFIHKKGNIVWGIIRAKWMHNDDGSTRMSIAHIQDITERKLALEKIKQSEQKYRLLFENMTSGFALHQMIYDEAGKPLDYRYIEANPAFEKLTGLEVKTLIGKTIKEVMPNIEDYWVQTFGKVACYGEPLYYTDYVKDFDRYYDTFAFSPEKDKFAVVFNDVTERVNAEIHLKISEKKFMDIFNFSPDMIGITRQQDGKIMDGNPAMTKITGYTYEEYIGKSTLDLELWADTTDRNTVIAALKEKGEIKNFEIRMKRKDDAILTCLFSAITLDYKNEACLLFVVNDITERKLAEVALKTINDDLEKIVEERTAQLLQANKDLESFAYSVSHDLRAPLRHIDGFVKLLYSNVENPGELVDGYFEKIKVASTRMSGMIDDLLTFSRLGRKDLTFSTVNLDSVINEIIEEFKTDTSQRDVQWIVHSLPDIPADKNLLKFAFENIISNALKYTAKKEKAVIEIGAKDISEKLLEIYFKDNGVGFDMNYLDKLFRVFQRLHSAEEFEGTGIGLANVKQIITKHNGSIRAEGIPNEGATFFITLPK